MFIIKFDCNFFVFTVLMGNCSSYVDFVCFVAGDLSLNDRLKRQLSYNWLNWLAAAWMLDLKLPNTSSWRPSLMMRMMNFVEWLKSDEVDETHLRLISSREHCQRFSPSQISYKLRAGLSLRRIWVQTLLNEAVQQW